MTKKAEEEARKAEALAKLRALLSPGDTVYTILRHISQSGMSRSISPVIVRLDEPEDISYLVAQAGIFKRSRNYDGVALSGAGMDMGFHLVYTLSRRLWPDGFTCTGYEYGAKRCPSNDHFNDNQLLYSITRHHRDGGYALNRRWL